MLVTFEAGFAQQTELVLVSLKSRLALLSQLLKVLKPSAGRLAPLTASHLATFEAGCALLMGMHQEGILFKTKPTVCCSTCTCLTGYRGRDANSAPQSAETQCWETCSTDCESAGNIRGGFAQQMGKRPKNKTIGTSTKVLQDLHLPY